MLPIWYEVKEMLNSNHKIFKKFNFWKFEKNIKPANMLLLPVYNCEFLLKCRTYNLNVKTSLY